MAFNIGPKNLFIFSRKLDLLSWHIQDLSYFLNRHTRISRHPSPSFILFLCKNQAQLLPALSWAPPAGHLSSQPPAAARCVFSLLSCWCNSLPFLELADKLVIGDLKPAGHWSFLWWEKKMLEVVIAVGMRKGAGRSIWKPEGKVDEIGKFLCSLLQSGQGRTFYGVGPGEHKVC